MKCERKQQRHTHTLTLPLCPRFPRSNKLRLCLDATIHFNPLSTTTTQTSIAKYLHDHIHSYHSCMGHTLPKGDPCTSTYMEATHTWGCNSTHNHTSFTHTNYTNFSTHIITRATKFQPNNQETQAILAFTTTTIPISIL